MRSRANTSLLEVLKSRRGRGRKLYSASIHDDAQSHRLSEQLGAQAFTWGREIFFSRGAFRPGSRAGRALLTHELTHVAQQSKASRPFIQRKVSGRYPAIRKSLSTAVFRDWWVTKAEVETVLKILGALSAIDLKNTVARMEKDGLVKTLFAKVKADQAVRYAALLERIHRQRVHKRSIPICGLPPLQASCTPTKKRLVERRFSQARDWAKRARTAVVRYRKMTKKHAKTGALLDRFFFHSKVHGKQGWSAKDLSLRRIILTFDAVVKHVRLFYGNFSPVTITRKKAMPNRGGIKLECASRFDTVCANNAGAYFDPKRMEIVACPLFFEKKESIQITWMLHEMLHAYLKNVVDRGYTRERIFPLLSVVATLENADSFAEFARVNTGLKKSQKTTVDRYSGCTAGQKREAIRAAAVATRMATEGMFATTDLSPSRKIAARRHFKTHKLVELEPVRKNYGKLYQRFKKPLAFECEKKCSGSKAGWHRSWGWTLHLCPDFFKKYHGSDRADVMLLLLLDYKLGLRPTAKPGTVAYKKQKKAAAMKNAAAYVAFARDVFTR